MHPPSMTAGVLARAVASCSVGVALFGSAGAAGVACGSNGSGGSSVTRAEGGPVDRLTAAFCDGCAPSAPMGACSAIVQQQGIEGANHVAVCTTVDYATNPPSSGDHYPVWAAYKTYSSPIPEGFWVHCLEHGAIVLTYNCAVGAGDAAECASEVAAAQKMIDAQPADPACVQLAQGVSRRMVLTPDPKLDVRFAASAWGWTLRANCFDVTAFQDFAMGHYDLGPESLCNDGEDPTAAGLPNGCGD